jgi:Na+-driven multidrug efflux pump
MRLRSPHDREIFRLALPALGALAAEPLYVLVDTAIVGHLGRPQIAALGLAGATLGGAFALFNFLAYGTTAVVARAAGAGQHERAARLAAQALWLSVGIGVTLLVVLEAGAEPLLRALGARAVETTTLTYFPDRGARTSSRAHRRRGAGLPALSNLRRPLEIVVIANVANIVLEVPSSGPLGTPARPGGRDAQAMGAACRSRPATACRLKQPSVRECGRWCESDARSSFVAALIVACRRVVGAARWRRRDRRAADRDPALTSPALTLDGRDAGQVIVGRMLGAGDAEGAHDAAVRMIAWSTVVGGAFAVVLLPLGDLLPRAFTSDPAVLEQAALLWPFFALMQPLGGAVFALDGILIGAGDTAYLMWSMLAASAVFVPIAVLSLRLDWGMVGLWAGLDVLIAARLALLGVRFAGRRWAVVGAH